MFKCDNDIYFIDYDNYIKERLGHLKSINRFSLEEYYSDHLILRNYWTLNKKRYHWYIWNRIHLNNDRTYIEAIDDYLEENPQYK